MKYVFSILLSLFSFLPILIFGQTVPVKNYHPPLNIPLVLSANFGELRANHFHMGMDFKTEAREGLTLHSIDEGYVSRVNVSPYGYGRIVYINHSGGITSVYAHCMKLTGKLEQKVKDFQTKVKSSETDIYFQPNEVPLKRGESFALSGNTGASRGPHLHFEIRDTYTEEAINPLFYGFDLADTRAPMVFSIKAYALDEFGFMCEGKTQEWTIKNSTIGNGTISLPSNYCSQNGGVGFAINGIDKFNSAENTCGIYGTRFIVNGDTIMLQKLDKVAFEHTRYLNAYTDYKAFSGGKKYHKSFRTVVNPLTIYKKPKLGILNIKPGKIYHIQYDAFDFSGNVTSIYFTLEIPEGEINSNLSNALSCQFLNPNEALKQDWQGCVLEIPRGCTYEPILKDYTFNGSSFIFKSNGMPVQEAFTVKLKPIANFPIEKQYLAVNRGGFWSALKTSYSGNWLIGKSKYFGEIMVKVDEKAPNIVPSNIKYVISKSKTKRLIWKIGDYQTGLADYGIEIDGIWQVLDYESKGDFGFYNTENLEIGNHSLIVHALDYAGNKSSLSHTIEVKE